MGKCDCCGCSVVSDYGTSVVTGTGTSANPYKVSMVDQTWQRPAAKVVSSVTQTIGAGSSFTAAIFNTEKFDLGNFWDVSQPTRFSITEAGAYIFGGCFGWNASAIGTRELGIRKNGTQILQIADQPVDTAHGGSFTPFSEVNYQATLAPGDYLELVTRQESAGNIVSIVENESSPSFWIVYAGRVSLVV